MSKLFLPVPFAAITLACLTASAQETVQAAKVSALVPPGREWSFYASAFGFMIPQGRSYLSPILTADRQSLHIEIRYNYENLQTGSLWLGRSFRFGSEIKLELTPMIGGVFGNPTGVAAGYAASLAYRRLLLDSQGQYLFAPDRSESFFYNWSEISYAPTEWFRAGIVLQRTRAYQTDFDIQRGLLAGVSYKSFDFTVYEFDLGWTNPTFVFAVGIRF